MTAISRQYLFIHHLVIFIIFFARPWELLKVKPKRLKPEKMKGDRLELKYVSKSIATLAKFGEHY